jgi:hypothetical protein
MASASAGPRRVNAIRMIRKMRGGSQSHLIECDDGRFWVVKFSNNPQHARILVNEWMASAILLQLQISSPEAAIIWVSAEFLARNPEVFLKSRSNRLEVDVGPHFGSLFPGDPSQVAVYDFLPDPLLHQVRNVSHFRAVLAFDKWTGNTDARQAIFHREGHSLLADSRGASFETRGLMAQMIDNGGILDAQYWEFPDTPLQGLYRFPLVYRAIDSIDAFQPWLDRVIHFPADVMGAAVERIPPRWLVGDQGQFPHVIARLLRRRERVTDLIRNCADDPRSPFVAWQR